MKLRRSVLALTIISGILAIAAIASFIIVSLVPNNFLVDNFIAANQIVGKCLMFAAPIQYVLIAYVGIAVALGLTIPWLIVDIKRGRRLVWLFVPMFLVITYCYLFMGEFAFTALSAPGTNLILYLVPGISAILAFIFMIILFIVDMKTGKAPLKEAKPAQIYQDLKEEEEKAPITETIVEETPVVAPVEAPVQAPVEEKEEIEVEDKKDEKDFTTEPKEVSERKTRTITKEDIAAANKKAPRVTKEDGTSYAKAYHVSRRQELNKWQVKATGSSKAIKLFDTQKEAIEYAEALSRSNGAMVRVHSKAGKLRKN